MLNLIFYPERTLLLFHFTITLHLLMLYDSQGMVFIYFFDCKNEGLSFISFMSYRINSSGPCSCRRRSTSGGLEANNSPLDTTQKVGLYIYLSSVVLIAGFMSVFIASYRKCQLILCFLSFFLFTFITMMIIETSCWLFRLNIVLHFLV